MSDNDFDDGLPSFFGGKNRTGYRQMAANIIDPTSFATRKRENMATGETVTLRTKGGMHRVTTEQGKKEKEPTPCVDELVKNTGIAQIKQMLTLNPNVLYGKQIGPRLFVDSDSSTPEVDVSPTSAGLLNFSHPAAEGDTHYVSFPWHKQDILLFGRDKHYCPFPGSSVKVGLLSWPFGVVASSGEKKVIILSVRVNWAESSIDVGPTTIEVFDEEAPSTVLATVSLPFIAPYRLVLNSTTDGAKAVLNFCQYLTPSEHNNNNVFNPGHPINQPFFAAVEFIATYDGAVSVSANTVYDWYTYDLTHPIRSPTPIEYVTGGGMSYFGPGGAPSMDITGWLHPLLVGYDKDGERVVLYARCVLTFSGGSLSSETYDICRNNGEVLWSVSNVGGGVSNPALSDIIRVLSNGTATIDHRFFAFTVLTNNTVGFVRFEGEVSTAVLNGVPSDFVFYDYSFVTGLAVASIGGDVEDLSSIRPKLNVWPGENIAKSYPFTVTNFYANRVASKMDATKSDDIKAGLSWNPLSGEFAVEGGPATPPEVGLVGAGFVGTRRKIAP